ncbi:MAG: VWA domain-containing protein [Archaeoglobaceae archaeon]
MYTSVLELKDKPPCKSCEKDEGLKSLADDLLYSLFNPYHKETGSYDVTELIKKHLGEDSKNFELFSYTFSELIKNFGFLSSYWLEKLENFRKAKKSAWEELKDKLKTGEILPEELSASQIVDNFLDEVIEELMKIGYLRSVDNRFQRRQIKYSKIAEKILGEKILELSLKKLEKRNFGENVTDAEGTSIFLGEKMVEFDPFVHHFDAIDFVESLLRSAVKGVIELDENDLVAKQPKHAEKCIYIMLIDVSDSMRGKKLIGAIESALGLKRAIRKRGNQDELRVLAFNHKVREIKEGEIANLEAKGRTDIGLALKKARELCKLSSGTPIIFLISDGEPTSSYNPYLTPWKCAMNEAKNLRSVRARLQIIMLGNEGKFLELCKNLAKLSGNANLIHVSDPLNLKNFVLHSYMTKT